MCFQDVCQFCCRAWESRSPVCAHKAQCASRSPIVPLVVFVEQNTAIACYNFVAYLLLTMY